LPSYSVFAANPLFDHVTLTFDLLTLTVLTHGVSRDEPLHQVKDLRLSVLE